MVMITKSNIALTNNFFQGFTDILHLLEKGERKREIFFDLYDRLKVLPFDFLNG